MRVYVHTCLNYQYNESKVCNGIKRENWEVSNYTYASRYTYIVMKLKPPRTRQLARSARVNEETMGSGFYHHFVLSFSFLDLRKAELDMAGRHERGEVEKGNTYSFFLLLLFSQKYHRRKEAKMDEASSFFAN